MSRCSVVDAGVRSLKLRMKSLTPQKASRWPGLKQAAQEQPPFFSGNMP